MVTIHVLADGELFRTVLNAMASFLNQDSFAGLMRITTLVGIIMVAAGYLKQRDPQVFAKWFMAYLLVTNVVLLPKTTVLIHDISQQTEVDSKVDNVPVLFAVTAAAMTTIGYGLAQSFDSIFSMPDDLQYHETGVLFGSKMIQATKQFRITNPDLKAELDSFFRNCVVGDIRINKKYTVMELKNSTNIWELITSQPSPLRMTFVNGKIVSCKVAASPSGEYSLKVKLDEEIKNAYTFFGIELFNKPGNTYEELFSRYLKSAADYYQGMTDEAGNIFLQSMMINAMGDGVNHYQAFTNSTAGVASQLFSKSQVQHRWSWQVAGMKAAWYLPILHTMLTVMLFALFPLVMALMTLPIGVRIIQGYLQFFLSLQLWPVMFAILNLCMTISGKSSAGYGHFTMVNLDKIDGLHADIAGVAGFMMVLIPFLANGLLTRFSDSFNSLATSMTNHMQSSTMGVAGEAASASFGLGQTSFYNTTANNLSANKHDTNYSNLHGMRTEQLSTGVLKTLTGSKDVVFDGTPGMSRGAVSIHGASSMTGSLNQAYEESKNVAANESRQYHTALSNASHRMVQLSNMAGHDMRLGDGVSNSETAQFSDALSTMKNIASDVAHRTGMSTDEAFAKMTSGGFGGQVSFGSDKTFIGKGFKAAFGLKASGDVHAKYDRSSTSSNRYSDGLDSTVSAKEAQDFNHALSVASGFVQAHHFDNSHSEAAQLSNQLGADLRDAQTSSHNYDVAMSRAERISDARNFVESHSDQINTDFNQAFPAYVDSRVGEKERDELFAHPGDMASLQKLQRLGDDFIADKKEELIQQFGNKDKGYEMNGFYQRESRAIASHGSELGGSFKKNSEELQSHAGEQGVGIDKAKKENYLQWQQGAFDATQKSMDEKSKHINHEIHQNHLTGDQVKDQINKGVKDATQGVLRPGTTAKEYYKNLQHENKE